MLMNAPPVTDECDGLLSFLDHQRQAVRDAVYGIDDEAARTTPTASGLSLGGLVKHLAYGEEGWADRIETGPGERQRRRGVHGEFLARARRDAR